MKQLYNSAKTATVSGLVGLGLASTVNATPATPLAQSGYEAAPAGASGLTTLDNGTTFQYALVASGATDAGQANGFYGTIGPNGIIKFDGKQKNASHLNTTFGRDTLGRENGFIYNWDLGDNTTSLSNVAFSSGLVGHDNLAQGGFELYAGVHGGNTLELKAYENGNVTDLGTFQLQNMDFAQDVTLKFEDNNDGIINIADFDAYVTGQSAPQVNSTNVAPQNGITQQDIQSSTPITGEYDLAQTIIPEPSTTAMLGLGGLALLLRRKR